MKKVAVVMSTYNGEKYLEAQVRSIMEQDDVLVDLYIFDDGSIDQTVPLIRQWMSSYENIHLSLNQKNYGAMKSFLHGLQHTPDADYYALADQDDVWNHDKLAAGIIALERYADIDYRLYCSVAQIVDQDLNPQGVDGFDHQVLSFGEILTRNNGIGCTFVFNRTLKQALDQLPVADIQGQPLHDQWIYAICLALGGKVFFDQQSHIQYRQHSDNVVGGEHRSFGRKLVDSGLFDRHNRRKKFVTALYTYYGQQMIPKSRLLVEQLIDYQVDFRHKHSAIKALSPQMSSTVGRIEMTLLLLLNRF